MNLSVKEEIIYVFIVFFNKKIIHKFTLREKFINFIKIIMKKQLMKQKS